MMWLIYFAGLDAAWLTFCKAMDVRAKAAPIVVDPVAEFRASLASAALPPGDHR